MDLLCHDWYLDKCLHGFLFDLDNDESANLPSLTANRVHEYRRS